jgi:hypothetical protein
MKKVFSILFASLILLSGMHFTVASHICCGELAAVKISVSGEKATCGMEETQDQGASNGTIQSDCCKNKIASCSADSNYFPSISGLKAFKSEAAPAMAFLPVLFLSTPVLSKTYYSMVGPPVSRLFNTVDQSFICVFII